LTAISVLGGTVALIPDILEPATNPNHRGFFHSIVFGATAWYATHGRHSDQWDSNQREVMRLLCYCYLSHLAADATTPKGICVI